MIANLNHDLIAIKGTPSGYNRDSAEVKISIMASIDEALSTISITNEMLSKIVANSEAMKKGVISSLPTKLADELVKKYQIPFRLAHKIVGKTVALVNGNVSEIMSKTIEKAIELIMNKKISIKEDLVKEIFDIENALKQYQYIGAASPKHVSIVNKTLKKEVIKFETWSKNQKKKFISSKTNLLKEVNKFINN
jgi:argininosuccinate lyase